MPIQKGGTIEVGGIKVTATNAFHSSSIALDDGSLIYGGEPLGYVIEFESGFKLYHAGDTCIFGDMQLIGELYRPDLALLPIGNQVVMSPTRPPTPRGSLASGTSSPSTTGPSRSYQAPPRSSSGT